MRIVFLDRDGVINKYPGDTEYVKSWGEFKFLPGVKQALEKLTESGFKLFIVSNQAGVSKGLYSKKELDSITKNMLKKLGKKVNFEDIYYCTHLQEENCLCRKPNTGMIENAISKIKKHGHKIDLRKSFFVGDTIRDVETGKRAGLKTILVFSGKEKLKNKNNWLIRPDFTAKNLTEAVKLIISLTN